MAMTALRRAAVSLTAALLAGCATQRPTSPSQAPANPQSGLPAWSYTDEHVRVAHRRNEELAKAMAANEESEGWIESGNTCIQKYEAADRKLIEDVSLHMRKCKAKPLLDAFDHALRAAGPSRTTERTFVLADTSGLSSHELHALFLTALDARSSRATDTVAARPLAAGSKQRIRARWGVAEWSEGRILTEWQAVDGRSAGLWWWKKQYEARARHIIAINGPVTAHGGPTFRIQTEVEERPNANYPWQSSGEEYGSQSLQGLKEVLMFAIREVNIDAVRTKSSRLRHETSQR